MAKNKEINNLDAKKNYYGLLRNRPLEIRSSTSDNDQIIKFIIELQKRDISFDLGVDDYVESIGLSSTAEEKAALIGKVKDLQAEGFELEILVGRKYNSEISKIIDLFPSLKITDPVIEAGPIAFPEGLYDPRILQSLIIAVTGFEQRYPLFASSDGKMTLLPQSLHLTEESQEVIRQCYKTYIGDQTLSSWTDLVEGAKDKIREIQEKAGFPLKSLSR